MKALAYTGIAAIIVFLLIDAAYAFAGGVWRGFRKGIDDEVQRRVAEAEHRIVARMQREAFYRELNREAHERSKESS